VIRLTLGEAYIRWIMDTHDMFEIAEDPISFEQLLKKLRQEKYSHIKVADMPEHVRVALSS